MGRVTRSSAAATLTGYLILTLAGCGGGHHPSPATFSISGTVAGAGGRTVTLALSGASSASTATAAAGSYAFSGLANGNYTVTPSLTGWSCSPASRTVTVNDADVTGQDFTTTAVVTTHSISGAVSGATADGVVIALTGTSTGTAPTAGGGLFSFSGLADGTYTLTPSKAGFTFTPASLQVTVSGADLTGRDFTAASTTIFADDFESYAVDTFPSAGGWSQIYSGAGATLQYVDGTHAVSGTRALHLAGGASCWSATVAHDVTFPQVFSYEVDVFVDQIVGCGCSSFIVELGPNTGYHVAFFCDGKIYARRQYSPLVVQELMPYQARTWYHVKVDVDRSTGHFSVYVDGALVGVDLQSLDAGTPTQFFVAAEHGASPVAWFDDVKVTR